MHAPFLGPPPPPPPPLALLLLATEPGWTLVSPCPDGEIAAETTYLELYDIVCLLETCTRHVNDQGAVSKW